MKNLYIYTSPLNKFSNDEAEKSLMIQIDNSLDLGWDLKDIILYTNFPWHYNGVVAKPCPDLICGFDVTSNKMLVIDWMFKENLIGDDTYFYHDLDAYENYPVKVVKLEKDFALCNYEYKSEWNCGMFFFNKNAKDIFEKLVYKIMKKRERSRADEKWIAHIIKEDTERFQKLNITYNITMRYTKYTTSIAEKPLMVLHFHFTGRDHFVNTPLVETFIRNGLVSDRLKEIFKRHGIE